MIDSAQLTLTRFRLGKAQLCKALTVFRYSVWKLFFSFPLFSLGLLFQSPLLISLLHFISFLTSSSLFFLLLIKPSSFPPFIFLMSLFTALNSLHLHQYWPLQSRSAPALFYPASSLKALSPSYFTVTFRPSFIFAHFIVCKRIRQEDGKDKWKTRLNEKRGWLETENYTHTMLCSNLLWVNIVCTSRRVKVLLYAITAGE